MNVRLLRRVAKHISEEPLRFAMGIEIQRKSSADDKVAEDYHGALEQSNPTTHAFPKCGTAACIGGWTMLLHDGMAYDGFNILSDASEVLDLPEGSSGQLFYVDYWPEPFQAQYLKAKTPDERVPIAVARIEHFIATKGKE